MMLSKGVVLLEVCAQMASKTTKPTALPQLPLDAFFSAIESWPIGVTVTEVELDEPGPRILYANPAFCTLVGRTREEIIGRSPRFLQGADTSREVLNRLRTALTSRTDFSGETVNYRSDGTPFVMQWSVSPIRSERGAISYFVALQRDVTEMRRLEALAEAVNLADNIGYTLTSIRHELGNPINSMKAAITLLRTNLASQSPDNVQQTLDNVLDEIRRVEYLLRGLRSFNAFETPSVEVVALTPFLSRFIHAFSKDANSRGCQIHLEEESPQLSARIDSRALYQVMINLVTNAMEALRAHASEASHTIEPTILIQTRRGFSGTVTVSVSDNGPGIEATSQAKVFHPFFTTKPTGTGLGLAIVKKLLAKMDSHIELLSEPGQGTTFVMTLPSGTEA
jgi:PAS domain S-box-containing protein